MDANADESDARRTALAVERTMLAWWRTGLAALAVALGVGRLLPELSPGGATWPYVALGIAFAVYATALFVHGTIRAARDGERPPAAVVLTAGAGTLLALATIVLIAAAL